MTSHSHSQSFIQAAIPCYDELKGFFRRRVDCQSEAEDLVQETFSRLMRRADESLIGHPRQYLFRVARNLLVDRARKRAVRSETSLPAVEMERLSATTVTPSDEAEARERLQLLEKTVGKLPQRCREVFILNRFYGLSYPSIAEQLSISQSTVEKHMIRAIAACRKTLKKLED